MQLAQTLASASLQEMTVLNYPNEGIERPFQLDQLPFTKFAERLDLAGFNPSVWSKRILIFRDQRISIPPVSRLLRRHRHLSDHFKNTFSDRFFDEGKTEALDRLSSTDPRSRRIALRPELPDAGCVRADRPFRRW
jgi:hypothetical protein